MWRTADPRGTVLAPHQLAAAERLIRILKVRRGAVLADEPGLGKTWVAGAIAAEGVTNGCVVEVVSPAPLRGYWREVLSSFGVEAVIVSHESLARDRVETEEPREGRLLIVDEAHRFRNPATKRYEGLAKMSVNARLLLVTATPVCNSPSDLLSLLNLFVADDELERLGVRSVADCFARRAPELHVVMGQLVVRRTAGEIVGLTPARNDIAVEYDVLTGAQELWAQVEHLTFPWTSRRISRELLLLFLRRRLESSVAALAATIRRMAQVCRRARLLAERGAALTAYDLRAVLGDPDLPAFQDILFPELWGANVVAGTVDLRDLDDEVRRLDGLAGMLGEDPKPALLAGIVRAREGTPGLVFTVNYDTATAVFDEMARLVRCALLTGRRCVVGGRRRDIDAVVRALRDGAVDLVVSTDVGGEGLNLEAAGYVVHYDQPWNPAIIEQRNGRICRIGQLRGSVETLELTAVGSCSRSIIEAKRNAARGLWSRDGEQEIVPGTEARESWNPPPALPGGLGQGRLVRLLRSRSLSSGEIVDLLSQRRRVGVERLIDRLVRQPIDAATVDRLRSLLRNEDIMIQGGDAAI